MDVILRKRQRVLVVLVAAAAAIVCVAAQFLLDEDDQLPPYKKRSDEMPYMRNNPLYAQRGTPFQPLQQRINICNLFSDPNRNYCHVFTSMFGWEFFRLADHLKVHIEVSRSATTTTSSTAAAALASFAIAAAITSNSGSQIYSIGIFCKVGFK